MLWKRQEYKLKILLVSYANNFADDLDPLIHSNQVITFQPGSLGSILGVGGILISILGLDVCSLSTVCIRNAAIHLVASNYNNETILSYFIA